MWDTFRFHQGYYGNRLAGFQQYTAIAANLVAKVRPPLLETFVQRLITFRRYPAT